jgi:hypothetical protein
MPLEIREFVIKATVDSGKTSSSLSSAQLERITELVASNVMLKLNGLLKKSAKRKER